MTDIGHIYVLIGKVGTEIAVVEAFNLESHAQSAAEQLNWLSDYDIKQVEVQGGGS